MPEPVFDFVPNFVCLTIRFKTPLMPYTSGGCEINGEINGEINDSVKSFKGSLREVYLVIKNNPGIIIKRVAEVRGKSESTVGKQLAELLEKGFIEYRGSKKTGVYYLL